MDSSDEDITDHDENESENEASDISKTPVENPNKRKHKEISQKSKKVKLEPISTEDPKKSKKKNELYKPPTIEELNNLKMTENLYNNNLFRLQIEELVKEVAIKTKRKKALSSWLENFKTNIENLPEFDDISLSDIKIVSKTKKSTKKDKFINNLVTNYQCHFKSDQDLKLNFLKPENIEVFGLYENNALAGPNLETSINITMPKSCFHVKDFLNNRYIVKRFYYLAYIAENLTDVHKKTIIYHENNILLPILLIQPTKDEKLIIKIHATPVEDYFKPSRFLPSQNNIKQDLFEANINDIEILRATPTILYNATLAHDVTLRENSAFVATTLHEHENVQEGIKLLCIWLKQRNLDVGYGAFTSNLIMYFVTYLLAKKKLNKLMSSYQIVRNFWSFLATTDLEKCPISLGDSSENNLAMFKQHFDIVFLDRTGCYNLATFLDKNVFRRVKQECEMAMRHLDDSRMESFHSLFLTKVPFGLQYDLLIDLTDALPLKDQFISTDVEKSKNIGYGQFLTITQISDLLHKGLGKRALNIVPHIEVKYKESPLTKVIFGINLNPETAFNFIEMGPVLNDYTKADEFRKFWGYLASDRRFRDGSTHVAVYFKTSTIRGKRGIIKRIIKYLLIEKLDIKFKLYYDEFEEFLLNKKVTSPYPVGTNEESCLKIIKFADELGQKLRSVQMSLSITGIQGLSDAFSYSEVFPPIAAKFRQADNAEIKGKNVIFPNKKIGMIPRLIEPLELVLQLEHSSKWPNNLEAIQHVKTSFYLEISKMLQDNHNIISHVTREYLEVFYEGLVFRYRLFVPKEIGLLKKAITETGELKYTENAKSEQLEKSLGILPKVNATLKGIQLQFPSFGPGTALIKRWLRSHLIDDFHMPDIVINLLNAALYVNLTSFQESCTPQIAFLRFLKFIAEFQWELQPVLVNFNEEITKEDIADLESKFQQNRAAVQPLYIIMPYDQGQSIFTKHSPSKETLHRVQGLAHATLKLVLGRIEEQLVFDLKELFKPNMEGYNLLIHLRPLLNPRRHEQIDNPADSKIVLEKYEQHKNEKIPIAGFNPVHSYLKALRESYGEFAMFFHDTYGGSTVGVLWNPKAKEVKEFKVAHINGKKLVNSKLELNEDAIIEDFYILGKGIVKWIEKK
ncbi:unnamed protein product [Ceutorhynchus assimilis]|uniref:Nucleolar protein 6 n=1 Tax=Ceutorhynchus assimilis TaxID=467358 RepID=A0A9N9QCI4_9CUCU|nr:unnamed protein product [Ceutorhynchus assimilis]